MSDESWQVARAFNWGILFVGDSVDSGLSEIAVGRDITVGRSCVVIPVRHAQDVDLDDVDADEAVKPFEVVLSVRPGAFADTVGPRSFEAVIAVPSGELAIGDADGERLVAVRPGDVRLRVSASPDVHAEHLEITYWSQ